MAVPQAEADDLKVDGLDVGTEGGRRGTVGSLDADTTEVVDEPGRDSRGD